MANSVSSYCVAAKRWARSASRMLLGAVLAEVDGGYIGEGLPRLNFRQPRESLGYTTYCMLMLRNHLEKVYGRAAAVRAKKD